MSAFKSDTLYNTMHGSKKTGPSNNIAARKQLGRGEAQIAEACGEVPVWMEPLAS
jgi:hypothetical protein